MGSMSIVALGFTASFLAGFATVIGAIPIFFVREVSNKFLDSAMGFSAGVMLAATSFSLLVPALEIGGISPVVSGFLLGALFVYLADKYIPHEHLISGHEGPSLEASKITLIILAITIHNFPEGIAVGVSFGTGDLSIGFAVATAIALQNIPEGTAVAFPMQKRGAGKIKSVKVTLLSGLVEPLGGFLGVALVETFKTLLPYTLAFAAGAMIYVVSDEMIPESHRSGFEKEATLGVLLGFILMMILDNLFT